MGEWITPIKEPITAMAIKIWSYVPNTAAAIIILLIGLVVVKIIASIVGKTLKLSKLDVAAEKSGLANMLRVGEIKLSLSGIIETLIYWLLVLLVVVTAAQALKFTAAAELITTLIAYIPNIIAAILILAIGAFLAAILSSIVLAATKNAGMKKAKLLSQLVKITLIIFAIAMALEQLKIAQALITQVITVILLSIGAGFAIAFGLGCKDIVAKIVKDFLDSLK